MHGMMQMNLTCTSHSARSCMVACRCMTWAARNQQQRCSGLIYGTDADELDVHQPLSLQVFTLNPKPHLQVYALGIKLLDGPAEVQHFPIEDILPSMEWRPQVAIAAACIADPYVLLHFSDGSAVLLSGSEEEGETDL